MIARIKYRINHYLCKILGNKYSFFLLNNRFKLNDKVILKISSDCKVVYQNGKLEIGKKWISNDPFYSLFMMGKCSQLIIKGEFEIYSGAKMYLNPNAELILGSGYINHNLNLSCFEKVEIGHGVAISENVCIRDSDNHEIIGSEKPNTSPVYIGNNVWIGMNVTILKGVKIGDGAIIAAGAVVNTDIPSNCLAGGVPAKVLKTNVSWK